MLANHHNWSLAKKFSTLLVVLTLGACAATNPPPRSSPASSTKPATTKPTVAQNGAPSISNGSNNTQPSTGSNSPQIEHSAPKEPAPTSRQGAYYDQDGPPEVVPPNLESIPDATPRIEAPKPSANRPYQVFGRRYLPMNKLEEFSQIGIASWYGKQFHGRKTSSGEVYDMLGMTAAHPTLPIPSYVKVTNMSNGKQVIVRVNDRGPFLQNRAIDLSYAAAKKLGYVANGHAKVQIDLMMPGDIQMAQEGLNKKAPAPTVVATVDPLATVIAQSRIDTNTKAKPIEASGTSTVEDPVARLLVEQVLTQDLSAVNKGEKARSTAELNQNPPVRKDQYYLQVAAFGHMENALAARDKIRLLIPNDPAILKIVQTRGNVSIRYGPFPTEKEARAQIESIERRLGSRPHVVPPLELLPDRMRTSPAPESG